jgi:hypothetical protein
MCNLFLLSQWFLEFNSLFWLRKIKEKMKKKIYIYDKYQRVNKFVIFFILMDIERNIQKIIL